MTYASIFKSFGWDSKCRVFTTRGDLSTLPYTGGARFNLTRHRSELKTHHFIFAAGNTFSSAAKTLGCLESSLCGGFLSPFCLPPKTHWDPNKIATILQTILNSFFRKIFILSQILLKFVDSGPTENKSVLVPVKACACLAYLNQ